jgi:rubrerythrin
MNKEDLIRQIRKAIIAEYGAIEQYTILAEQCDDELVKKVLIKVANEERIHVGEFLHCLLILSPDEEEFYTKGSDEVNKIENKEE